MPEPNKTPRETAALALAACEKQGAWPDGYLKNAIRTAGLTKRDAALATRLCFGVLQNRLLLDHYLSALLTMPLTRLDPAALQALRLGAYQILFLDRIPEHAAVSESVALTKRYARNPRAAGVVNAVLRNLIRSRDTLCPPEDPSTAYSHPQWLVDAFRECLGSEEELTALLCADNADAPTVAQINTCRTSAAVLDAAWKLEEVSAQPHPWLPDCRILTETGALEELATFREGLFYVQDTAARLAVEAAAPAAGMRVLDACAAPGGKSFACAIRMEDRGEILACDIHPHKEELIRSGAQRLGLTSIRAMTQDAKERVPEWEGTFDLVLADVPCSGLGIIRKKPDIRYKDPASLKRLPEIQRAILDNVSAYVKPGGVLLYATCTLLRRENEEVVLAFLRDHPGFASEPFVLPGEGMEAPEGMLTLWPHRHGTDGFFMAKLRRID